MDIDKKIESFLSNNADSNVAILCSTKEDIEKIFHILLSREIEWHHKNILYHFSYKGLRYSISELERGPVLIYKTRKDKFTTSPAYLKIFKLYKDVIPFHSLEKYLI